MSAATRLLAGIGLDLPPLERGRPGDPGLFGPRSVVWRVARERILLAAGPAALLMQIAHPVVAAGVVEHSQFPRDASDRLRATLDATLRITFGDRAQAAAAGAAVESVHRRIHGRLGAPAGRFPAGTRYDATRPDLAMWVYATLIATSIEAYERLVGGLRLADRERHYQEAKPFARMFGVTGEVLPADHAAFRSYFEAMVEAPDLAVGEDARALAEGILRPPVPRPARASLPLMRLITAALLPGRLRAEFGLSWTRRDRALAAAAALSIRTAVRLLPRSVRYWSHYRAAMRRVGEMGNEQGHSSVIT